MKILSEYRVLIALILGTLVFAWLWSMVDRSGEVSRAPLSWEEGVDTQTVAAENDSEPATPLFNYIEIINSCGPSFEGECAAIRVGPSATSSVVMQVRSGMVLKVAETITHSEAVWYKIAQDEYVRYPERIGGEWYVSAQHSRLFANDGTLELSEEKEATSTKRIIIDRSEQMLYAYEGETLFMKEPVSTGLEFTPTPRGEFTVYKMTPSRYMQGPLPGISDQYYDLPGVPWNLYFTHQGAVIHGAYWHDSFGAQWSHGCVNLSPEHAEKLYTWAEIGMYVLVKD